VRNKRRERERKGKSMSMEIGWMDDENGKMSSRLSAAPFLHHHPLT